jgi:uncharacterized protein YneF (UPF0154 family)
MRRPTGDDGMLVVIGVVLALFIGLLISFHLARYRECRTQFSVFYCLGN